MAAEKKLALVGYGKMGKLIGQLAPEYGFEVTRRFTAGNNGNATGLTVENLRGVDVAIEFSTPDTAALNVRRLAERGVPTVAGSTGWLDQLPNVSEIVMREGTALVWSPNFSAGATVFRKLTSLAAWLLRDNPDYGAWAWEIHHDAKKDALSGTLLQLVKAMEESGYPRPISVSSNRAGRHPGTHEIGFDSAEDTITLRHTARNREGFARGALHSARWILGRQGVYTFEEVLFG